MPSSIPTHPDAIARLTVKDKEYAQMLEDLPPFSYDTSDPDATIDFLRTVLSHPRKPDVRVREHEVKSYREARNGQSMSLYIFEPAEASNRTLPLVILFHGGGGTVGSPRNVAEPARTLVLSPSNPCVVVAPQYLLAPENAFPAGTIDAYDAVDKLTRDFISSLSPQTFSQNILGLLPSNKVELRREDRGALIVGGVSAGATMSCVLGHLARDLQPGLALPISGLYLGCPAPLPTPELVPTEYRSRWLARSSDECTKEDPLLPKAVARIFDDALRPDTRSPLYAPFAWPRAGETLDVPNEPFGRVVVKASSDSEGGGHAGLPPMYIQVCGRDRARDDALIFASELLRQKVSTRVDIYKGLPHMFWGLFTTFGAFKAWQADTAAGVAWLLAERHDTGCSEEDDNEAA